jgi:ankyrin repeat protein
VKRIFRAILASDDELARLLKQAPQEARTRATHNVLLEAIPHWLYVGDTGLHLASAALRVGAVTLLIESGAELDAANRRGATALHYACDPRPSSGGVWAPAVQEILIARLVGHGAAIDRGDNGGATALHRAVRARSAAAVRALLQAGARVDCRLKRQGSFPLHLAVQSTGAGGTAGSLSEQIDIVRLLLHHGADPAAPDAAGRTARDRATHAQIVAAL